MKSGYEKGLTASKNKIRKLLLRKRNLLKEKTVLIKSTLICKGIKDSALYKNSKTVMFYYPHGNEVNLKGLMSLALKEGKKIVFPYVKRGDRAIYAKEVFSLRNDLEAGEYGIMSPVAERCAAVNPKSIDIVLVPAIAFDVNGQRIGYGKGYFDRWLKKIPIKKRVGIAYSFQVLKEVPHGLNDKRAGSIITENGIVNLVKQKRR